MLIFSDISSHDDLLISFAISKGASIETNAMLCICHYSVVIYTHMHIGQLLIAMGHSDNIDKTELAIEWTVHWIQKN